jgi:iron complex outermembrane receptor protein
MRQWVVLSLLALGGVPTLLSAEGKIASSRELLKMGFFQDFDELDLLDLIEASDVRLRIAARRDEALEDAAGVVSILTDEDMALAGVRTLEEALRLVPGVDVTTDALGRPRVSFRGMASGLSGGGSEDVLILLNGHRIDDPLFGGGTPINPTVPVANVKRIEVLRGAASALFGSGAVAGVVDVITYDPEDYSGIELSAEAGSFGTQRYGLRVGSATGEWRTFGLIQFEDVVGAKMLVPEDSQSGRGASLAPGDSRDGLRSIETNYRVAWREYELNLRVGNTRSDGYIGLSDALGDGNDLSYRQIMVDLTWQRANPDKGNFRATALYAQNRYRGFLKPLPPGFAVEEGVFPDGVVLEQNAGSRRFGVEGTWERDVDGHRLLAGLALGRESAFDAEVIGNYDFATGEPTSEIIPLPGTGGDAGRTTFSAFVQDNWSPAGRVALTGGLRFDQIGDLSALNPRLAAVFKLPGSSRLKLLYGRAFRAPTLAEQEVSMPLFLANGDLEPVRVDTLEAALVVRRKKLRLSASAFASFLRDPIRPTTAFDPERSRALENTPGLNLRGIEIELRRSFGVANSVFGTWTLQSGEEEGSGRDAAFVPSQLGTLGASLFWNGRFSVTPVVSFRGRRLREAGDTRGELPAYGLLGVTLRALDVVRNLNLSLSAQNLLDERYYDPALLHGVPGDYPRAGRSLLLQAAYKF